MITIKIAVHITEINNERCKLECPWHNVAYWISVWHSGLQCDTVWHSGFQCGRVDFSVAQCTVPLQCGIVWLDMAQQCGTPPETQCSAILVWISNHLISTMGVAFFCNLSTAKLRVNYHPLRYDDGRQKRLQEREWWRWDGESLWLDWRQGDMGG